ncbi:MAG: hypothetical protein RB191_02200 [Terriglobia bacterium]|nr:hypothetical protein [Terriglobia bacterium]
MNLDKATDKARDLGKTIRHVGSERTVRLVYMDGSMCHTWPDGLYVETELGNALPFVPVGDEIKSKRYTVSKAAS